MFAATLLVHVDWRSSLRYMRILLYFGLDEIEEGKTVSYLRKFCKGLPGRSTEGTALSQKRNYFLHFNFLPQCYIDECNIPLSYFTSTGVICDAKQ
jgi:hypothetical protein